LTPEERRDPRLLVYYDFEEAGSGTVLDQSTTGAHGTLKNGARIIVCSTPADVAGDRIRPISFSLEQNYPNPFNPVTELVFSVEKTRVISLDVYGLDGRRLETLISNESYLPGRYTVRFNGAAMPSGIYIAILQSGEERVVRKMMLVK
ncbi:MAG: T9SS type A sorting domain-containing protein, partial [Chlorobi bacterium]|nr:T9SS type A sorting domain-containing protein [Chlorobiota bacterium]